MAARCYSSVKLLRIRVALFLKTGSSRTNSAFDRTVHWASIDEWGLGVLIVMGMMRTCTAEEWSMMSHGTGETVQIKPRTCFVRRPELYFCKCYMR